MRYNSAQNPTSAPKKPWKNKKTSERKKVPRNISDINAGTRNKYRFQNHLLTLPKSTLELEINRSTFVYPPPPVENAVNCSGHFRHSCGQHQKAKSAATFPLPKLNTCGGLSVAIDHGKRFCAGVCPCLNS
jgi:hypothetical protein